MNYRVGKTMPVILSIFASAGVVGTAMATAKIATKANKELAKAKETKSKKHMFITFLKEYKYPLLIGTATVASIVTGTIISKKVEASLSATALMLDTTLRKYKGKVKELLGDKAEEITKDIAQEDYQKEKKYIEDKLSNIKDNKELFYEEHIGFFRVDPNDLDRGLATTNEKILSCYKGKENIVTDHFASFKTFIEDSNIELVSNTDIDGESYDYGWTSEYIYAMYEDDIFLHLSKIPHFDKDGVKDYTVIIFDKEPIFGVFSDYDAWERAARISAGGYRAKDIEEYENFNDPDYRSNERK